ncbi:MAG: cell division protein SepF, partial [Clostridia bacterium]|nr:cell division protein SepF [Clostridia bacterium]
MSIVNKVLNLIGFETEEDYEEELLGSGEFENSTNFEADESETLDSGKRGKVVKIHTTAQLKLVVMQPET